MYMLGAKVIDELVEVKKITRDSNIAYMLKANHKALSKYPRGVKVRMCPKCNCALVHGSISYNAGIHVDSCY